MSFSFVQGPSNGPQTGTTITGTVAGNFLLVYAASSSSNPAPTEPTGLYINALVGTQLTWTKIMSVTGLFAVFGEYYRHTWWVSNAIPAGIAGSIIVSTVGSPSVALRVHEISCGDSELHVDGTVSGTAAATVNPSVNLVTTEPNGAVFSAMTSSHVAPTPGAGYTNIAIPNSNSFEEGEYDLDHGAAGTISVPWTASSTTYLISAFSLQEGPIPVPAQPQIMVLN